MLSFEQFTATAHTQHTSQLQLQSVQSNKSFWAAQNKKHLSPASIYIYASRSDVYRFWSRSRRAILIYSLVQFSTIWRPADTAHRLALFKWHHNATYITHASPYGIYIYRTLSVIARQKSAIYLSISSAPFSDAVHHSRDRLLSMKQTNQTSERTSDYTTQIGGSCNDCTNMPYKTHTHCC